MSDKSYAGAASAPTAGTAVVTSDPLSGGRYTVSVTTYAHGGSPAAAEEDNLAVYSDTTQIGPVVLVSAVDDVARTPDIELTVGDGKTISVKAVGNATSGVTYVVWMLVHRDAGF